MYLGDVLNQIETIVEAFIEELEEVKAEDVGLDKRACYDNLLISHDGIAVSKSQDGNLQYYGGFEYVDKEFRHELGTYVFYEVGDSRVKSCVDRWSNEGYDDYDDEEGE